jgi:tetratricopeptide (TPR) repeat protein
LSPDAKEVSVDLIDIPVSLIHEEDDLPELVSALIAYDAHNWELAKTQLAPIARTGNRLALFKFANTLDNLGDLVAAEHYWRLAVAGGDTNAGINLANLLKDEGRNHEEVIALYQAGIDAGNVDALRNLGVYIEDDDPEGAAALYMRAVDAGDAKSCANLALKYFTEDDFEKAMRFAELGFSRGSMYSFTAVALYHMRREEWELTLAAARRALTLSSPENLADQTHPYNMVAIALINLLRFDEGEKAIQDCVDHGISDTTEMLNWLALMREAYPGESAAQPSSGPNFCTNCGTKVQQGNLFCSNCGSKL